jgi:glutamine synthetase
MSSSSRRAAIQHISRRGPEGGGAPIARPLITDIFGINVFNDVVQRQRLPKAVYQKLRETIDMGLELDSTIADVVASAMKEWAIERRATHYTHWFQPQTGLTAEKHDSFINLTGDGRVITEFSGKELIKGEPDASSFPSGGLRATFEARGYTAWDPTSPAFLRESPGGVTLCIPTAFCSWTGEALDKKTPLLRSIDAVSQQAVRLLRLIGAQGVKRVWSTNGPEQEYFLVDRELANLRPDLVTCGRTLFGARPPKGQELEDHYFGAISQRVLSFMQELEHELWKLGIPVKTRHNEVAPSQFELAPIFERAGVAGDHNMLTMEIMRVVAERHGMRCVLHEKPFAGVNGSGKHVNWSLADNLGQNLLEPGSTPHENLQFMVFLTAVVRAVDIYADLLRATVAHAGNDHRLGANEAPPAIISIFLGAELETFVDALVNRRPVEARGGKREEIRLGVTTLPPLPRDITDRNRTSPFAFTGNKFEFRAVGSSQSIAYPVMVLNTIAAESIDYLATQIEERAKRQDLRDAIHGVVAETLAQHRRILFAGDGYTAEWQQEAERRGLPNLRDTTTALAAFASPKNAALFEKYNILSRRETESRQTVQFHNYVRAITIEAQSALQIAATMILPASLKYEHDLARTILDTKAAASDANVAGQQSLLKQLAELASGLKRGIDELDRLVRHLEDAHENVIEEAKYCRQQIVPAMAFVRDQADKLENIVNDDYWPLPKYREILFIH